MGQKDWQSLIASATGGLVSSVVMLPFDVVKTRVQSRQFRGHYDGLFPAIREIIRGEGVSGLYRGLPANVAGLMPSKALNITIYDLVKARLTPVMGQDSKLLPPIASACSSFVTATTLNPLWVVRTRMQLQQNRLFDSKAPKLSGQYSSYYDAFRTIYKEEGIRGYSKGLTASYFGIFEWMIYFTIYEYLKKKSVEHEIQSSVMLNLTQSSFSKLVAVVIAYPYEVVRTRQRESRHPTKGFIGDLIGISKGEGVRALYSGMRIHLLRTVPGTAITFSTYELVLRLLRHNN
eukprot:Rmarinus@m.281